MCKCCFQVLDVMALHLPPVKYIAALVSNISHADQLILVQRLIFII